MTERAIRETGYPLYWNLALPLLVAAVIYAVLIMMGDRLLNDPDIYWHTALGRWITEHRAVPHGDPFSFTRPGAPWIAMEWLSQVIFFNAYSLAGWNGIVIVTITAIGAAFALLARFLIRELSPVASMTLIMAALLLAGPHIVARPHVLALPVMVAWISGLVGEADRGRLPSFALLPLITLWANLHAGFTLGLALILPLALESVISARHGKRRRAALHWLSFGVLAGIAACLTPYGIRSILVLFHVAGLGDALTLVDEWKPQDFGRLNPFELCLLLGLGFSFYRGIKLPVFRFIVIIGFLHLALWQTRNADLLGMMGPLFLAKPLGEQLEPGSRTRERLASFISFPPRLLIVGLAALFALGVWGLASTREMRPDPFVSPVAAVDAIEAAHVGPVFNEYGFGGYLIFRGLAPFIDGRAELYGEALTMRHDRAVTLESYPDLLALLEEYRIGATLLPPGRPATALLDNTPGWRRLYADDIAVVHVRAQGARAKPE